VLNNELLGTTSLEMSSQKLVLTTDLPTTLQATAQITYFSCGYVPLMLSAAARSTVCFFFPLYLEP